MYSADTDNEGLTSSRLKTETVLSEEDEIEKKKGKRGVELWRPIKKLLPDCIR
jgi:hypothetical protein